MPSRTAQVPPPRNLLKRSRITSTIIDSDNQCKGNLNAPSKKLAQVAISQDSPIKSFKKKMASELFSTSGYRDEQIEFNRMILEGQYGHDQSDGQQTKTPGMMIPEAEDQIRQSQYGKETSAESAEIEMLQLDQMFVIDASQVKDFGELVRQEASKQLQSTPSHLHRCLQCHCSFKEEWKLIRHQYQAHVVEAQYTRCKTNGSYSCRICLKKLDEKYALKKHLFKDHNDNDVGAHYGKTLESIVGKAKMDQFRKGLYVILDKMKLNDMIEKSLNPFHSFKIEDLNWDFPTSYDPDLLNAEKRKLIQLKRRDIVLKLAKEVNTDDKYEERFSRNLDSQELNHHIPFDLTQSTYAEQIPFQALSCLERSRRYAKISHEFLPHFISFTRNAMAASLQLSSQPIMLRSLISNRAQMSKLAPNIVCLLLKGLSQIHSMGLVVQNIQPSTIFINMEATALNFADILHLTHEGAPQSMQGVLFSPYLYNQVERRIISTKALRVKDRFSVGVIILEILLGTELIINATFGDLLQDLMYNCSQYLDTATLRVLKFLLFNEGEVCLNTYAKDYVMGEPDVVHDCISKFETALLKDGVLIKTKEAGVKFINKHKEAVYERYRIFPSDMKSNVDWDLIVDELSYQRELD